MAKYLLRLGEREVEAELEETADGLRVNLDGNWHDVQLQRLGNGPRFLLILDNRLLEVLVSESTDAFQVQIGGRSYEVETGRRRPGARRDEPDHFIDGRWLLRAPLTGAVVEVRVGSGDVVVPGDVLLVIEAMKMLNELRARVPGNVAAVNVEPGQRVEIGEALIEIAEAP